MPENIELSERELEILRLVATGASNKEIAQQLYISPNTVKVHLKNIFSKVGAASRTEAAMAAVQLGLVQSSPGGDADLVLSASGEAAFPAKPTPGQRWRAYGIFGAIALVLLLAVVAVLLATGRLIPVQALASPPPPTEVSRWEEKASLQIPRFGLAAAAYENQVYAIGGETEEGVTGLVERYDPERNQWVTLAPKPTPVTDVGAVVIGGVVYVPGGRLASGEMSDALEVYDPREDRWEKRASIPIGVSAYALTAHEGNLYLFGGWDGKVYLDSVYEYDPAEDRWRKRTPMPTPRAYAGASVASGKIYVIGGYDGKQALAANESYQPELEDSQEEPWSKMAPLPAGRYAMGITSLADIIHVIGGVGEDQESLVPVKYFPQLDEWQVLVTDHLDELQSWSHLQLAPIETRIFALGGRGEAGPKDDNLVYQAIYTVVIPFVPQSP